VSSTEDAAGPRGIHRYSDVPVVLATLGVVALLVVTIAGRITFPYDLEWMEGGVLLHARRVMQGEGIYVTPTSDFIPFIYPPLYHWVVAALGKAFGLSHTVGRAVSVVGTFAAAALAVVAARGEGVRWGLSIAAAGLYLSTFDETGAFFDLVRIDGLFMGLTMGALVAGRQAFWRTSGILLTLAFATKHNAALFGLPILIWAWRNHGRAEALTFAKWSVLPALTFTVLTQLLEGDGLFLTYLLGVPGVHPFHGRRFIWLTQKEEVVALPVTTALLAVWAVAWWRGRVSGKPLSDRASGWLGRLPGPLQRLALGYLQWWRKGTAEGPLSPGARYWLANGALALLLTAIMRGHHGGYINVLMPGMWVLSFAGVVAIERLRSRFRHPAVAWLLPLLVVGQLSQTLWKPTRYTATDRDREAGDKLVEVLAAEEGELLAPWSPWLLVQAGKEPGFHLIGLWDLDHEHGPLLDDVATIRADADARRWSAIVVMDERQMPPGVKQNYRRREALLPGGPSLKPKTGWRIRPKNMWRPKK